MLMAAGSLAGRHNRRRGVSRPDGGRKCPRMTTPRQRRRQAGTLMGRGVYRLGRRALALRLDKQRREPLTHDQRMPNIARGSMNIGSMTGTNRVVRRRPSRGIDACHRRSDSRRTALTPPARGLAGRTRAHHSHWLSISSAGAHTLCSDCRRQGRTRMR